MIDDPRVACFHRLPVERGASVVRIEPRSLAERAGLRVGDVIVGFKGQALGTIDELHKNPWQKKSGFPLR